MYKSRNLNLKMYPEKLGPWAHDDFYTISSFWPRLIGHPQQVRSCVGPPGPARYHSAVQGLLPSHDTLGKPANAQSHTKPSGALPDQRTEWCGHRNHSAPGLDDTSSKQWDSVPYSSTARLTQWAKWNGCRQRSEEEVSWGDGALSGQGGGADGGANTWPRHISKEFHKSLSFTLSLSIWPIHRS